MLGRDVVDGELDQGDPVVGEGLSVGADGRVAGGFQQELWTIRVLGETTVSQRLSPRGCRVDREAEDLGVEVEGGSLVVDVDAGEADLH
jgi:hypothetical protein